MIAKDKQIRGMIHPSKTLTPHEEPNIQISESDFIELRENNKAFKDFGIIDIIILAETCLSNRSLKALPYTMAQCIDQIIAYVPEKETNKIGLNLYTDSRYEYITERQIGLKLKRIAIFNQIKPNEISKEVFLQELDKNQYRTMLKLLS
jgi:hypothetical protein